MTIYTITTDQAATVDAHTGAAFGDVWIVYAGVTVTSTGRAIDGSGFPGYKSFLIYGNLAGETFGLDMGDPESTDANHNRAHISATGTVFGTSSGVQSYGGWLELTNDGSIFSVEHEAIYAGQGHNTITNSGTVASAESTGILAYDGDNSILNTGTVTAGDYGILAKGDDCHITNTGGINANLVSQTESYGIGVLGDYAIVANSGSIQGFDGGIGINGDYAVLSNSGNVSGKSAGMGAVGVQAAITNDGTVNSILLGIRLDGAGSQVTNTGAINCSDGIGISSLGQFNVMINHGTITAKSGMTCSGGNARIVNTGSISAIDFYGIAAVGDEIVIQNDGIIVAGRQGISVGGGIGNLVINRGSISTLVDSPDDGVVTFVTAAGETCRLINSGDLLAINHAVIGGDGDETVINRGAIFGDVSLGGGSDVFRGGDGSLEGSVSGGAGNDRIFGGSGDDILSGNNGNDILNGGSGNDILTGGKSRDVMAGDLGDDVFAFNSVLDSTLGTGRDRIADFVSGSDLIDVSTIDADTGTGGNQTFTFIGASDFNGLAGELQAVAAGNNVIVAGDVDGDGLADFAIIVLGVASLAANDFVL